MTPAEAKAFREAEAERLHFIRQAYEEAEQERSRAIVAVHEAIEQGPGPLSQAYRGAKAMLVNWLVFAILRLASWAHRKTGRDLVSNFQRVKK